MGMNKKLYNRIAKLHDDGADRIVIVRLFITLAKNPDDAALAIVEYYKEKGYAV